ncbi:hypothetical protein RUM43_008261 [Polyplax serrata]|uniref:Uncharacterized protein n=1 Tax=Polyplax serrata TaxID=468196 RepID=A0AAN8P2X4_POLSC
MVNPFDLRPSLTAMMNPGPMILLSWDLILLKCFISYLASSYGLFSALFSITGTRYPLLLHKLEFSNIPIQYIFKASEFGAREFILRHASPQKARTLSVWRTIDPHPQERVGTTRDFCAQAGSDDKGK